MTSRPAAVAMLLICGVSLPVGESSGAVARVAIEDDAFAPADVTQAVGDEVRWTRAPGSTGPHNVREDDGLFRSGPVTTGPIDHAEVFSAGTFHYFCEAHGSRAGGMEGFVRVPPTAEAGPAGKPFRVVWASASTTTGSRFDVRYRAGGGRWLEWKDSTRRIAAVFGKGGEPVKLRPGASYSFRVRSLDGEAASRWSPQVSFRV